MSNHFAISASEVFWIAATFWFFLGLSGPPDAAAGISCLVLMKVDAIARQLKP